jgi:uracil-DNA glycosylase
MDLSRIHPSWMPVFDAQKVRLNKIHKELAFMRDAGVEVYPREQDVFKVFEGDIADVKLVLLGQDPYINPNQAMGLSFSVPANTRIPPSLLNIFKELEIEYPATYKFINGDLTKWFETEHIFLLNSALTVRAGCSGSHMEMWEKFTNNVIKYISHTRPDVVFLLLGSYAKSKKSLIPHTNIVECVHPSPLSAHNGFFGSKIFQNVNQKLENVGHAPINWQN